MQNIALYVNKDRDNDLSATKEVVALLKKYNKTVYIDKSLENELDRTDIIYEQSDCLLSRCDMILALGGDGTILKIVQQAASSNVPVAGINLGHLGFLTIAEKNDLSNLVKILEGEYSIEYRMMLEARVISNGNESKRYTALNDVIIRGDASKMISLSAEVDGITAARYLADGIIISTSTGSTAYSLSCGGPIVHKGLDCMIMTPICPHTMKSRCVVVPPESCIAVKFDASYCSEVDLKIDGISVPHPKADEYIEIVRSLNRVPMINVNSRGYFDVIREKLSD